MRHQLISIDPVGGMNSLMIPGGIDLRIFGKTHVERTSLIEFDETRQAFYIRLLQGPFKGAVTDAVADRAGIKAPATALPIASSTFYFREYAEAVAYEIELVQALRIAFFADVV